MQQLQPSRWAKTNCFIVRYSRIQGRGAFATRRIREGQRIIEYIGRRISAKQADRTYPENGNKRHHTFLFTVGKNIVIDAKFNFNKARFINHSCAPNCDAVEDDGRIYLEAMKNIQPGVELTYDYSFETDGPLTDEDRRMYPCHCGTARCRGSILKPKRKRHKNKASSKNKKRKALSRKKR